MKARETIYIGNRILAHDKSDFLRALDDLARQVTIDRLAELGENLTTETFRDVIRGGQAIRARMEDHMKNSIKALFFPAEKRKKTGVVRHSVRAISRVMPGGRIHVAVLS